MKFLCICIAGKKFGLPINLIREILENSTYTPVEKAEKDILGLMNVRGQIVTVLSPGIRFGGKKPNSQSGHVVILKKESELNCNQAKEGSQNGTAPDLYAFEVEHIDEVYDISSKYLISLPGNISKDEAFFLSTVARLENKDLLPILHARNIIYGEIPSERNVVD
jgi:purine-binding chemotaxis protein CheW